MTAYKSTRVEIMSDLAYCSYLRNKGWTSVDYPHGYKSDNHATGIQMWVNENLGQHYRMGRTYYFKDDRDATAFLLMWI